MGIFRTQDPRADFQVSNSPLAQQDPSACRLLASRGFSLGLSSGAHPGSRVAWLQRANSPMASESHLFGPVFSESHVTRVQFSPSAAP